ncbi:MAG: 16S rRNA (adenine(1518)-N(6)/adenine(1519)-N(6))-dimethyltransferase RsmA [Terriglobia bacterium]
MPRRPKLGQHFLRDPRVCRKIADSLRVRSEDLLIEIGPGRGVMTHLLAQRCRKLVAIEVDPVLAASLRREFHGDARVEILEQDVLRVGFCDLCDRHRARECYVFGSLPYYITSPILHHVLGARRNVRHATVLVQREVAQRLTAAPGSRAYGYLSVFVQCFTRPEILFEIPPGAFSPPPKVRSALVDMPISSHFPEWDDALSAEFLRFAQLSFALKRKTLLNNLAPSFPRLRIEAALEPLGLGGRARAEQISLEELAELFQSLRGGSFA